MVGCIMNNELEQISEELAVIKFVALLGICQGVGAMEIHEVPQDSKCLYIYIYIYI
jgi:hypothetical protein